MVWVGSAEGREGYDDVETLRRREAASDAVPDSAASERPRTLRVQAFTELATGRFQPRKPDEPIATTAATSHGAPHCADEAVLRRHR